MQPDPEPTKQQTTLNCLEGQPAPPVVIEGWKQLCALPRTCRESFRLLLESVLMNPENATNKELILLFSKEHDVPPESLWSAMGCCELLLKQAAALDLPQDRFRQDIEALTGGSPDDLGQFILTRYPDAIEGLRRQILLESLAGHGKVMTGLQWRLDTLKHSSKGNNLNTDIVLLTLSYREGQNENSITLQLTEDAARQLKKFCDRFTDRRTA